MSFRAEVSGTLKGKLRNVAKVLIRILLKQVGRKLEVSPTGALLISHKTDSVLEYTRLGVLYEKTSKLPNSKLKTFLVENLSQSSAQSLQDLLVMFYFEGKRDGYFVEFGACDGIEISNTYLLEKEFGWTGILAEPARGWHKSLRTTRSAIIDTRAVFSHSGELVEFREVGVKSLSGIAMSFRNNAKKKRARIGGKTYLVETVSLNDLLDQNGAPKNIDFLSIDTEGSEFEIISELDFYSWSPKLICIEHGNDSASRLKIENFMKYQGYKKVFSEIDSVDDWYSID